MKWEVKIDTQLLQTYSDIRLGLMRFNAVVKEPDVNFWKYMDNEILPQVKNCY